MSAAPADAAPRSTSRRTPLIIIGASVLLLALIAVVFRPPTYMRGAEGDPENPDPDGAMAIAEILRDHGAEVKVVRSVSSALAADTDLLVVSNAHLLSTHQLHALEERALDTVLIGATKSVPGFLDDVETARVDRDEETLQPGCDDLRAAAGPIDSASPLLTAPEASACFPGPDHGLVLTWERDNGARGTILPKDVVFNEHLQSSANAALAVRVLGEAPQMTWLVGSADDTYGATGTAEDFSLTWLWAIIGCLFIAAIWWRGPRFGKLSGEPLPVLVNASETTVGRGHLYRRSGDLAHTATALRLGTLQRLAPRIGLPAHATAGEVTAQVARAARRPAAEVEALLYGPPPNDAHSLQALALSLDALEDEVEQL